MDIIFYEEVFFMGAFIAYVLSGLGFFAYLASGKKGLGNLAVSIAVIGFLLHNVATVLRVIESGRLPFSNQYEFASSFTWGIVLVYLVLHFVYKYTAVGAFVMPLAFLMMGYASMLPKTVKPLMPALQSWWLNLHVGTAIIAYGSFAVACGLSIMYLINLKNIDGEKEKKNLAIPSKDVCDYLSYRVTAFGYLMLTLVIITGAIWAKSAWSRYWGWDPKETWSFITWIIYSVYLHLRFNRGWKGKAAAWFSVIGFICVLFTFVGVNILLPGIHSYK